jgi:hypothetical protein
VKIEGNQCESLKIEGNRVFCDYLLIYYNLYCFSIMNSINLYRCLLKNAKKIEQYNFRSFAIRKVYNDY